MWADSMLDVLQPAGGNTGKGLQLATMTGPASCQVGSLVLSGGDLLVAEHLKSQICTKVIADAPDPAGPISDKSTYLSALKAGDTVLIYQISDTKFIIIAKVV